MPLALFDLDNTLLAGDSDHAWGEFLVQHELVDPVTHKQRNDGFYDDYLRGELDIFAYQRFALSTVAGKTIAEASVLHQQFMHEVIEPMILPAGLAAIEAHRQAGDTLIIITATNDFVTAPIAKRLGISELIATQAAIVDGRYSGDIMGTPSYAHGKVERMQSWLQQHGENLQGSIFYSDSHNDIPLLSLVETAVCVDPDEKLRQYALEKQWQITSFRN